jgi:hypothetical protein
MFNFSAEIDPNYNVLLESTPYKSTRGVCITTSQMKDSNKLSKTVIILIAVLIPLAMICLGVGIIVVFPRYFFFVFPLFLKILFFCFFVFCFLLFFCFFTG